MASNIDKLIQECEKHNHEFRGTSFSEGLHKVWIHNPRAIMVGRKPVLEEMRDELDYELSLEAWYSRGTFCVSKDKDFNKAIKLAIEYFKE